jgi:hypothetical protein
VDPSEYHSIKDGDVHIGIETGFASSRKSLSGRNTDQIDQGFCVA